MYNNNNKSSKKWRPRQVTILWLPTPFGVEIIRPSVLGAPKTSIHKRAIFGLVQWILVIPNPIPIKYVTISAAFFQKTRPSVPTKV